jgi:alkanesulfonate monooxygenase SsuD/methylene tetrahydromethanopterin reductase-like flavin-dependent oxidoreductase (luciferase family)
MAGAALAGVPQGVRPDPAKAGPPVFAPPFLGGPDTVLAQIEAVREQVGMGRVELCITGVADATTHENVLRVIELAGQAIIPALHAADQA